MATGLQCARRCLSLHQLRHGLEIRPLVCGYRATTPRARASFPIRRVQDEDDEVHPFHILGVTASLELPLPHTWCQPAVTAKERKALKSRAESLARDNNLVYVHIGQQGVSQSFLNSCMDALAKNEVVRVKLGEGCGYERREAADLLQAYLDCVCVHMIGYTITLYRQKGLARPSNCETPQTEPVPAVMKKAAKEKRTMKVNTTMKKQEEAAVLPPEFTVST